jgi:hypothetical protein
MVYTSFHVKTKYKIKYYQIKSSRINMGGWGKGGRGIEALNLLQLGKAYNGRINTQTEALVTRREKKPLIDMTSRTPLNGCSMHNTSAVNLA